MPNNDFDPQPSSEELLDFLLEHVPDVIFFKDRQGRFLRVNHAFLTLFGLSSPDEVVGKTDLDFLSPKDAKRTMADEAQVLASGMAIVGSISHKHRPDGSSWWALTTKLALKNASGAIIGTCGISRDISKLKQAETDLAQANAEMAKTLEKLKQTQAQLIESEKAQSIARLAEGVAHEVRNPLAVVSMCMDFFGQQQALQDDENSKAVFEDMKTALERADQVIETLLQAARPAGLDLEPVDVNTLVERAYRSMSHELDHASVTVSWKWIHEEVHVMADPERLQHVIVGLLCNALEAMPNGGQLTLRTRVEAPDAILRKRDAGSRRGQVFHGAKQIVCIDIEDSGCGIPEDAMPRIFDAFFTSKETGPQQGLGLGLTSCRAIVELHGGLLEIVNLPKQTGVRATILLPRNLSHPT